jgi:hypothetical protein
MRISINAVDADGGFRRSGTIEIPFGDPPASAERRDLERLVLRMLLHDGDVSLCLTGSGLKVTTPNGSITATLPGPLSAHAVRELVTSLGIAWT